MRKQLVSAFLTWAVVLGTISSGSFATTSKGINPGLIPYPIDPDREPLAAALVRNNVWAEDPDEAARIHRASKPRVGKRSAYADTRDNYFNHASELEGEPIEENERAFREYYIFVNIDPNGSIPATILTENNSSYSGYIKGDKLRNALAVLTAADNTTRLDKATYDLYLRTVWQLGNQPLDVRKMFYDKAMTARGAKTLQDASNAVFGADTSLKASLAAKATQPSAKPGGTSRKATVAKQAQPSSNPVDAGSIKQRTIAAWNTYNTTVTYGGEYWQHLVGRVNAIRKLNLRNVDPEMITYFRLLDQKYAEEIPVYKAWEDDYWKAAGQADARDAECQRARELRQPCERDAGDALGPLQDFLEFSGRSPGKSGGEQKWRPVLDRLDAKYDPTMAAILKRLELSYENDFYSSVFDKQANDFFRAGLDYVEQEKWADAVAPLRSALRVNPNHLWAHLKLGFSYYALGQYELALDEFREHLRLNPNRADPQTGIGLCYYRLKRYTEAVGPLREVIRLKPENPTYVNAYYYLGVSYLMTGDRSAALAQYRILQRIDAAAAADLYKEINKR